MSVENVPVGHYDYIDPATAAAQTALADKFAHGYVAERAHCLRADVVRLLITHSAIEADGSGGWAIFLTGKDNNDESVFPQQHKEVLVFMRTFPVEDSDPIERPHIRIIANELYEMDNGKDWLVVDTVLDNEDDAQYFVGVFPQREMPEGKKQKDAHVPLFYPVANGLGATSDLMGFTHADTVAAQVRGEACATIPFGLCNSPWDRLDAIARAQELLAEVGTLSPAISSANFTDD